MTEDKMSLAVACIELVDDLQEAEALARRVLAGEAEVGVVRLKGHSIAILEQERDSLARKLLTAESEVDAQSLRRALSNVKDFLVTARANLTTIYIKDAA